MLDPRIVMDNAECEPRDQTQFLASQWSSLIVTVKSGGLSVLH